VGILGNAELLEADVEPGSMARVAVDQIRDAGSRAAGLTRQLLTFAGKDDASEETFDLSALVRGTSELMRSSVSRETDLVAEYATRPVWITADPGEMRQVVLNIVANAAEAYADRQGSVIVRTGIQKVDEQYLSECYLDSQLPLGHYGYVEVCDTGAGIADGDMERIFDPFFSTKFKGRGLGLAAVLGIVSRRHGTIRVESEPGSGTTMRILLPSVEPS
jgi:signal transduction histidine kinase